MAVFKIFGLLFISLFALVGLALTTVFLASQFHFTDVAGVIDMHADFFNRNSQKVIAAAFIPDASSSGKTAQLQQLLTTKLQSLCQLKVVSNFAGDNANKIYTLGSKSDYLFSQMLAAVQIRLQGNPDFTSQSESCAANSSGVLSASTTDSALNYNVFPWLQDSETWDTLKTAVLKDKEAITNAAQKTGVEPRMLVTPLFVEQWREYTAERELFKTLFKPLQTLATSTSFSLGVMNIKQDTAKMIEDNLKDPSSDYYLGASYEHLLDFTSADHDKERFDRLASYSNRNYSYLYGAVYLAELEHQWAKYEYPIANRPEILATLFNLGFKHSSPKPNPIAAGAEIDVGQTKYTFGGLAYEFYYSGELADEFPYQEN